MSQEQETAGQPAIVQAVLRAPPHEQQLLLAWARGLAAIRVGDLRGRAKAAAVLALTRDRKAAWPLVKVVSRAFKHIVWDARSWKLRLGVGAVVATFVAIGNEAAGTVHLGGGIWLPVWVILGAGGALSGLVVDQVRRHMTRSRAGRSRADA